MSGTPSCVPPNQTQPASPPANGMMLAAWFCTQGEGRKASRRSASDSAALTMLASGWPRRPGAGTRTSVVLMGLSLLAGFSDNGALRPAQSSFDHHHEHGRHGRDIHVINAVRVAERVPD